MRKIVFVFAPDPTEETYNAQTPIVGWEG